MDARTDNTAARAADVSGLPPTYISVGGLDLFLEENMIYADRLSRAGVPVELHMYPRAYHGFYRVTNARVTKQATIARRCDDSCTDRTPQRFCQAFTPAASANRGQLPRTPTALQRTLFSIVDPRVSAAGAFASFGHARANGSSCPQTGPLFGSGAAQHR